MLCTGNSIALFIAGRILQGTSAAVVWTVGLALLADTVGQKDAGQAMGYVGLAMSLGILVGPLLGGIVFARAGYYAVFGMAFGLIGLDIVLRFALIEKRAALKWLGRDGTDCSISHSPNTEHTNQILDRKRQDTGSAQNEVRNSPAQIPDTAQSLRHRLPPMITLLGSRRLLAGLWACLVQASLLTAFDAVLPLFVRHTFGWSSIGAGLIFLAVVIPTFISPIIGWLSDRHGPRWYAAAGFVFTAPFLILLRFVTHNSLNQKVLLCALLVLIGFGDTLVFAPITAEITYVVEAKESRKPGSFGKNGAMAQAYGLFNMAWAAGCLVGPIWGGMVNETAGWGTMAWTLGLLSFVTAIPTVIWTGGSITKPARRHTAAIESDTLSC
ncbi:MAG: hypothetical protein M1820_008665 [Bogoriella megaspora]|nr:MAG: hypothetical protein M1820_008665 [Bogoriella megaspora]